MLDKIQWIELPKIEDSRGALSFFEHHHQIPFQIGDTYWMYQMPRGKVYGRPSAQMPQEFIVALRGQFEVVVSSGKEEKYFVLASPHQGLYLPTGLWRCLQDFSEDALALIVSDAPFTSKATDAQLDNTMVSVYDCPVIPLQKTPEQGGFIVSVDHQKEIPFEARRVFYLYEVPKGQERGAHAHKELQELIIAARGSFSITLDDGENNRTIVLDRPDHALLVKAGIWLMINDFSLKSLCLVLASQEYDEGDNIRDYKEFLKHFKKI